MSESIISVEHLSKKYTIGENLQGRGARTFRDVFDHKLKKTLRRFSHEQKPDTTLWALKDISFEVHEGEVLGIIGRNGAGKSTLLKILSRITEPTEGKVTMWGQVASLLEVGTGFNMELSGRENIFLNGAILGMRKSEIKRQFDEIVDFAEIEKFIDTPVKRYSTGMYLRLAFAVAAHLETQILIVDEVLAVGDYSFQQKCLGKMDEVSKKQNTTVLFVSHNMTAILNLCQKGILLEKGVLTYSGGMSQCVEKYHHSGEIAFNNIWLGEERNELIRIEYAHVMTDGQRDNFFTTDDIEILIKGETFKKIEGLVLGFWLISEYDYEIAYSLYDDPVGDNSSLVVGPFEKKWIIPKNTIAQGTYRIKFDVGVHLGRRLINGDIILKFNIENAGGFGSRFPVERRKGFAGLFRPFWQA